ncbi:MAG: class I SAM-dependent methyltransferase [Patescibacteria group bacterium]|nr:class I SAM-dependent methyltransferase [Patescibacteria group bacterium]
MICVICNSNNISFFTSKNNCDIFCCNNCKFKFVYPIKTDTSSIYSDDYFHGAKKTFGYIDYDSDKEPMISTFIKYLKIIEKIIPNKGKLLDIGAATGFFIKIAKNRGWVVEGVELSDFAANKARNKGLDVKTGTLSSGNFSPESYDVVTIFDVIEHFPDPISEIQIASRILKKGGVLAINTPDTGSFMAKIFGKKWHLIVPPEHLHYFNSSNLSTLLEKKGFKVIKKTKIGKHFTPQYIFKMLYMWQKLWLWKKFSFFFSKKMFSKISISINTRDNIFIIAIKK